MLWIWFIIIYWVLNLDFNVDHMALAHLVNKPHVSSLVAQELHPHVFLKLSVIKIHVL